jgi:hypothetical protein
MSPIPLLDGISDELVQAGFFATYFAGVGAAGGAFAANAKGEDVTSGFTLGASWGAVVGAVVGSIYEFARLTYPSESKEAGDANEKMKFLALKDRSILYTDYSAVGYVYFPASEKNEDKPVLSVSIPIVRGDPSKDWITGPNYAPQETIDVNCKSGKCERYKATDESPLVCECHVELDSTSKCNSVDWENSKSRMFCNPVDRNDNGSCAEIGNDFFSGYRPT